MTVKTSVKIGVKEIVNVSNKAIIMKGRKILVIFKIAGRNAKL